MKTLYNISCINSDGLRVLASANQGRYFFATEAEAEEHLAAVLANNSEERLASIYGTQAIGTFRVDAFECYDNGDATGVYVGSGKIDRKEYLAGNVSHAAYYLYLADMIGREQLEAIVSPLLKGTENASREVPLFMWDRLDFVVRPLVARKAKAVMAISWKPDTFAGNSYSWSLSETVCVAKAVADRMQGLDK